MLRALAPSVIIPTETGGWHSIKCPFHGDREASASCNPTTQRFRCHRCGISGDGYDVICQVEVCDIGVAVQRVKEIGGQMFIAPDQEVTGPSRLASRRNPQRAALVRRTRGKR